MKHAYLIVAHNQFALLKKLIELLDNDKNDIFIHIDKKAGKIDFDDIRSVVRFSNVYFSKRIKIYWGGFSIVKSELSLLELAIEKGEYSYYHLLSGVDLPLKSADDIFDFFEKNRGVEFVHFCSDNLNLTNTDVLSRIKYYYPFQIKNRKSIIMKYLLSVSQRIQEKLKVNRIKNNNIIFGYGAQWFSITDDLANYIIENKKIINKYFRYTFCPDELVIQTLVINSDFKNHLAQVDLNKSDYPALKRLIDWERGKPYTYRMDDYELLKTTECLFARKFDEKVDSDIINSIYNDLMKQKKQKNR